MTELEKYLIREITIARVGDYYNDGEWTHETIVHDIVSHKPTINVAEVIKLVDDAIRSLHRDLPDL